MGETAPHCGARGKNRGEWGIYIGLEARRLLEYCIASGTDRKSIPPNTAEAFLKSLQEYLEAENGFQFAEGTKSLPHVKLTYIGPLGKNSWEWTEDCWMTPEGKVYIPAKAQYSLAYRLSKTHKHETLPPIPERDEEPEDWEPRYIRFLQRESNPDGKQRQLLVEVHGIGDGLAGISFG
jgi:hypothetical protein